MQARLSYKFEDSMLFLKVGGEYSIKEVIQLVRKAMNNAGSPERFPVLIDARLSEVTHNLDDLELISKEFSKLREKIICTAVVVQSDLHFGLARQLSVYDEFDGRETEAFRKMEPALAWVKKKM